MIAFLYKTEACTSLASRNFKSCKKIIVKNKITSRMIKQLSNSVLAKYHDLSVSRRSIICLYLWHRQIFDLLATDKSRYFVQPPPMIA